MAKFPTVRTPTVEEVLDIADSFGLNLSIEDAESFQGLMGGTIASYDRIDDLVDTKLPVKYPRTPGHRPEQADNKYNAWYWKSEVKGKKSGPLAGKKIVLKDNICLSGVPMMNGADVCAIIRKTSDIPIIMFTSADEVSEVNGAILKGATDFVLKTTGMDQLASRVEAHLLRQREPLKPLLTAADSLVLEGKITDKPPENIHLSNGPPNAIKTFTVIIDPDKESRAKITSVLIRLNQNFIEVESAGEGIAAIQDYKPQLVVTEWTLPDMDTFKMFSSLGEGFQAKSLTRIIMSDRLSPEIHRKSNFVGINNFLEKPVDPGKAEVMIGSCIRTAFRKLKNTAAMAA